MLVRFEGTDQEVKTFRETQRTLVRAPFVLRSALRDPAMQALVKDETSPVEWLTDSIQVEYVNDSDILQVSMRHADSKTAKALVNAVTNAYLDEVADADRKQHNQRLEVLRSNRSKRIRAFQNLSEICDELASKVDDQTASTELKMKQLDLESLKKSVTLLAEKIELLEVEMKLPPAVVLIQPADVISK